jgi:hypothetical protein
VIKGSDQVQELGFGVGTVKLIAHHAEALS